MSLNPRSAVRDRLVTGDLTNRLVIPSLYNLAAAELMPEKSCVVGVARRGMSNEALRRA
jgi:glucose-6-phosphate 1-dehydrogenase